ncbi:uncharacterized protein LOC134245929 [Saccostrea cucullata]|uniref:uncharacterized protein LOC134245929 n=1 Tax=Saccostrea cuccullata TaxID=36930 RepID=UPI002ED332A7
MICIIIIVLVVIVSVFCYCPDSIKTLSVVPNCPENVTEWTKAASKKNCSSRTQNCTEPSNFMYHCLINTFLDKMIEVCAPTAFITDFCCEFNTRGAVIQRNYRADCRNFPIKPCDKPYFSYEVYKHPECYALIKNPSERGTTEMSTHITSTISGNEDGFLDFSDILPIILALISVTTFILAVRLLLWKKRAKQNRKESSSSSDLVFILKIYFTHINGYEDNSKFVVPRDNNYFPWRSR